HARRVAEPASVRIPAIVAYRLAPADHVIAAPLRSAFGLEYDPAMDRENTLPAAGAPGENEQPRLALGARLRQHADAPPVGVAVARRMVLRDIERCVQRQREQEQSKDSGEHFSQGLAHGD